MKRSTDRIITTHVGSLPRPKQLVAASKEKGANDPNYEALLKSSVAEIVREQLAHGIDVIDDGEYSKPSFVSYANSRLGGFERRPGAPSRHRLRDHLCFPEYYAALALSSAVASSVLADLYPNLVCVQPVTYTGHAALKRDLENLKAALIGSTYSDVFVPAISPENAQHNKANEYYSREQDFELALADALREEYKTIVESGFLVQIDDPQLITYYNRNPDKTVAECRKWAEGRVEVVNYALRGIPPEKIRLHVCYSFDMAPRLGDMDFGDILDVVLKINAGGYSFEGANPRHEHEWQLWKHHRLADGKVLIPGVVGISSVVVEHPDLVAERIVRFANLVGRENVIASTDCGFATLAEMDDIHPSIAWAKLDALVEGARRASRQLWRRDARGGDGHSRAVSES
jgi:5-methyltetrahydropteroyltriglutamate--homocysteine methyltransferase